jgi:phosphatidate cytidylyltransferase
MNRVLTAIALIAVTLYLVFWSHPYLFLGAAVLMGLLCYREFSSLVAGHGIRQPGVFGVLGGLLILFWPAHALIGMTLLVLLAFAAALRFEKLHEVLPNVACIFLGSFYAFAPWHYAVELRRQSVHLLFFALSLNWAGDSIAYYVGRSLGRRKLAPIVSPKKSWEGAMASVLGSVILGLIYLGYFVPSIAPWKIGVIAAISNVAGQLGDLAESAIKRGAGVKDSGNLLPGHGGMLDRVDSSLFALPIAYVLIVALGLASK